MIKLTNFTNNGVCSNCGECCSDFLHLSDDEIERINNYLKEYKLPQHQKGLNTKCPFRNDLFGKCDIYSVRPHICRIFKCDTQPEQAEIIRDEVNKERKPYSMAELFFNDSSKRKMLEALGINILKGNEKNESHRNRK